MLYKLYITNTLFKSDSYSKDRKIESISTNYIR